MNTLLFEGRAVTSESLLKRYDEIAIWYYFTIAKFKIIERVTIIFLEIRVVQEFEKVWKLNIGLKEFNNPLATA